MKQAKFTYYSHPDSEERMFDDVKAFLEAVPVGEKLQNNILLAISEAFTNALVHGNKLDDAKMIEVILAIKDRELFADIIDEGEFDLSFLHNRAQPELLAEGGRGIDLIKGCADSTEYLKDEKTGGLRVSLKFKLDSKISVW